MFHKGDHLCQIYPAKSPDKLSIETIGFRHFVMFLLHMVWSNSNRSAVDNKFEWEETSWIKIEIELGSQHKSHGIPRKNPMGF